MKIFQKFFKSDQKLNANEVAIETKENKFQQLDEYLKNFNLVKLWQNQNTNADFNAQDITLSNDNYDFLIWFYGYYKNENISDIASVISLKLLSGTILTMSCATVGSGGNYYTSTIKRSVTKKSNTVYEVGGCERSVGTSTPKQNENNYCIPIYIIGGRF